MPRTKKIYFHKEAHIYFLTKKGFDGFSKGYKKNPEWYIKNKKRYKAILSITQILSIWEPFTGGDLKIAKAWLSKEATYQNTDQDWLDNKLDNLNEVEAYLNDSLKRSIQEGNEAHRLIQEYTVSGNDIPSNNIYFETFKKENIKNGATYNIDAILPYEVSSLGKTKVRGGDYYAGMWDLLIERDGKIILIDIKTGSPLIYSKKQKVQLQLNGYVNIIEQKYGIKVDEIQCWEVAYTIPFKDLKKRELYIQNKLKNDASNREKLKEVQDKIKGYELSHSQGKRNYYFKIHEFKISDDFEKVAKIVFKKLKLQEQMKETK